MEDISQIELVEKLPVRFRQMVLQAGVNGLEEIRFRIGQPLELVYGDRRIQLCACCAPGSDRRMHPSVEVSAAMAGNGGAAVMAGYGSATTAGSINALMNHDCVTETDVRQLLNYLTGYSIYAYEEDIRQGYFTIPGGHRIGVAGRTSTAGNLQERITGIVDIGAVNIRIAHEHKDCAKPLMPYIRRIDETIYNTLILAQPGVGKTTYLRDCIRLLSKGEADAVPLKVAVVDERSEIAACCRGVPQNDVGPRTDVLDGCLKRRGMQMLLRSMSPQVIAVDELGDEEDFRALYEVMHSGIRILGTVHAGSIEEIRSKPYLQQLIGKGRIERMILLSKNTSGGRAYRVYEMCACQ